MSYAVSALIGLLIGVGSIFSPQPAQSDQEKSDPPAVERKKDGA
jgi:hypothetical protein